MKINLNICGFTLLATLAIGITQETYAGNYKNTQSYKYAYSCGLEAAKDASNTSVNAIASSCVGNSHEPDKIEMLGYKDAFAYARKGNRTGGSIGIQSSTCTFAYGVYIANGSRADSFEEGPQKVKTMKMVARIWPGREFKIFDANGRQISNDLLKQWFYVVKRDQYGEVEVLGLTSQAKKTCSKKQIG